MSADSTHKSIALPQTNLIGRPRFVMTIAWLAFLCVISGISFAEMKMEMVIHPQFRYWAKVDLKNEVVQLQGDPRNLYVTLPAGQTEITEAFPMVGPDRLNQHALSYAMQNDLSEAELIAFGEGKMKWLETDDSDKPWVPLSYEYTLTVRDETLTVFPMEVIVKLLHRSPGSDPSIWSPWRLFVDDRPYYLDRSNAVYDLYPYQNGFRDLLSKTGSDYEVGIRPPDFWSSLEGHYTELSVTLRKSNTCLMMVSYSGDIEGSDSGDLAYYNNFMKVGGAFEGGVGRATGSGSDAAALARLDAVVDWNKATEQDVLSAAEASAMAGTNFNPLKKATSDGGSDSAEQKMKDAIKKKKAEDKANLNKDEFYTWLRGEPDERETFGLSMAGRNADRTNAEFEGVKIDRIRGVGQLMTSSVLLAASRDKLVEKLIELTQDPDNSNPTWDGIIPLSRLEFRPLGMGALFSWSEGNPGAGRLKIDAFEGGKLRGTIDGILFSREMRRPDGSSSKIHIHATFLAAEGAFGCDLPSVGKVPM